MTTASIISFAVLVLIFLIGNWQKVKQTKKEWQDVIETKKRINLDGKKTPVEKAEMKKEINEALLVTASWYVIITGYDWHRQAKVKDVLKTVDEKLRK